jgi:hypothetical protein
MVRPKERRMKKILLKKRMFRGNIEKQVKQIGHNVSAAYLPYIQHGKGAI